MDEQITHDDDFYGWSQQQAAALRRLAARVDVPNDLDLEHVAEEIEDVGNAQRSSVESFIGLILVHLLKAASVDDNALRTYWHAEIVRFHGNIVSRFSKSMRQDIDMARLWRQALKEARLALASHGQKMAISPKSACPLEVDEFIGEDFDFDAAIARIEEMRP
jgi:hypothetical protein